MAKKKPDEIEWLVDYSKTPDKSSLPGSPNYDPAFDPDQTVKAVKMPATQDQFSADLWMGKAFKDEKLEWWQQGTGAQRAGGPFGLDLNAHQAANLESQLHFARMAMELQYPGAVAKRHSAGGVNAGEPETEAYGGSAGAHGSNEWVYTNGDAFPGEGISIHMVLDQYNIYD